MKKKARISEEKIIKHIQYETQATLERTRTTLLSPGLCPTDSLEGGGRVYLASVLCSAAGH